MDDIPGIVKIIFGFLGCGGFGFLVYLILGKMKSKSDIQEAVHSVTQTISQGKIDKIEETQKPILEEIKNSEILSKETKEKIEKVKEEAEKEIIQILKEESFEKLEQEENKLW